MIATTDTGAVSPCQQLTPRSLWEIGTIVKIVVGKPFLCFYYNRNSLWSFFFGNIPGLKLIKILFNLSKTYDLMRVNKYIVAKTRLGRFFMVYKISLICLRFMDFFTLKIKHFYLIIMSLVSSRNDIKFKKGDLTVA